MSEIGRYPALESKLSSLQHKYDRRADTNAVRFALASSGRKWHWEWFSPSSDEQYLIASATKLYVTALIVQLRSESLLDLDAPAAAYLHPSVKQIKKRSLSHNLMTRLVMDSHDAWRGERDRLK